MNRPSSAVWLWMATALLVGAIATILAFLDEWAYAVAGFGLAAVAVGAAVATWGKELGRPDREHRHQKGPGMGRRRFLMRLGAVGASLVAAAVVVPAALQAGRAAARLRDTGWGAGIPVVDDQGRRIVASEVVTGSLYTVYPEGRVGDALAQAVLVGVEPERIRLPEERAPWAPEGLLAYSKLCTHMACPVGLYEDQSGTVVCPCHQAVFDLLVGGESLAGPAERPLPQLPVSVHEDGYLIAAGGFSDFVGTGFWSAP